MDTWTIYGPEGECQNCEPSHPHPLHNIISETIIGE